MFKTEDVVKHLLLVFWGDSLSANIAPLVYSGLAMLLMGISGALPRKMTPTDPAGRMALEVFLLGERKSYTMHYVYIYICTIKLQNIYSFKLECEKMFWLLLLDGIIYF